MKVLHREQINPPDEATRLIMCVGIVVGDGLLPGGRSPASSAHDEWM